MQNIRKLIENEPLQKINDLLLTYTGSPQFSDLHHLPKVGEELGINILRKIKKMPRKNQEYLNKINKDPNPFNETPTSLIIRSSGNYWYNAFSKIPYKSIKFQTFLCSSKAYRDFVCVLINSSLFYFWMRVYGSGRDLPDKMLNLFCVPEEKDIALHKTELVEYAEMICENLDSVKENNKFNTRLIKDKIDLLDDFLAKIYNLSPDELAYIKNYDHIIRNKHSKYKTE